MFRKLAFLAIFLAFVPQGFMDSQAVATLQLQLAVMLSVVALVLHDRLQPFQEPLLNRLEKRALLTLTLTFLLLACAIALEGGGQAGGRIALLVLAGVLNALLLVHFLWIICSLVWSVFGRTVLRMVGRQRRLMRRRAQQASGTTWAATAPGKLGQAVRSRLGALSGVGTQRAAAGSSSGVSGGSGGASNTTPGSVDRS